MKSLWLILALTLSGISPQQVLAREVHVDVVGANVIVEINGKTTIVPFDEKDLTDGNVTAIVCKACKVLKCLPSKRCEDNK